MTVSLFDLDYTLLEGDTEWLWGEFLAEKGLVSSHFLRDMTNFFCMYENGDLDIYTYQKYLLQPIKSLNAQTFLTLQNEFCQNIGRLFRSDMLDRLEWHRSRGHIIILISATSQLLVEPISHLLPVDDIICTRVETINHLPTGQITGIPAYREGKVQNLLHWLEKNSLTLEGSWAYSDSINDIPLLDLGENSVAVTPDAALRKYAMLKGWRIMDL